MITFQYRTLVAFFAGITIAIVAGFAFQAWRADAAPGDLDTTFVPTTPCRLVDTRPAFNVGPRDTPLGAADTHVQQVTGTNGNCTIPTDATGVSMNVTAVEPSTASFMTIFPSDAALPVTSNLNYFLGAPPTPNKVDVKLSADGKASFYNLAGSVHLIADIGGYYTSSSLVELADQIATAEGKISALEALNPGTRLGDLEALNAGTRLGDLEALTTKLNTERPVVWTDRNNGVAVPAVDTTVVDVSLTAPAAGNVTLISTTTVREDTADEFVACSIADSTVLDVDYIQRWESPGPSGADSQLAGVRVLRRHSGSGGHLLARLQERRRWIVDCLRSDDRGDLHAGTLTGRTSSVDDSTRSGSRSAVRSRRSGS